MALINHAKREINAKIVYYGREGVGKRVSLQYLYDRIKPSLRGEFKSVPANGDELLFFDFSPFEHPVFGGYRVRFHMYSLTGRVANPAAWKMTLKGADGVVIIADGSSDQVPASREQIMQLREFLSAYGVGLNDIPCVLQLNRNGNPDQGASIDTAAELNVPGMQTCFSDSGGGEGVLKALSLLSRDILSRIGQEDSLKADGAKNTAGSGEKAADGLQGHLPAEPVHTVEAAELRAGLAGEKPDVGPEELEPLQVAVAGEVAADAAGIVRIPLDVSIGGATRRLVVSVAIEQV